MSIAAHIKGLKVVIHRLLVNISRETVVGLIAGYKWRHIRPLDIVQSRQVEEVQDM